LEELFCFDLLDTVLLHSPSWPQTCTCPASAFQVVGYRGTLPLQVPNIEVNIRTQLFSINSDIKNIYKVKTGLEAWLKVEHLISKHKILSSNPSTTKKTL
jgi:hypothetical protein